MGSANFRLWMLVVALVPVAPAGTVRRSITTVLDGAAPLVTPTNEELSGFASVGKFWRT